jgi:hypothetical protein
MILHLKLFYTLLYFFWPQFVVIEFVATHVEISDFYDLVDFVIPKRDNSLPPSLGEKETMLQLLSSQQFALTSFYDEIMKYAAPV